MKTDGRRQTEWCILPIKIPLYWYSGIEEDLESDKPQLSLREVYEHMMDAVTLDKDDQSELDSLNIDEMEKKHFKRYVYIDPEQSTARLIYR